MSPKQRWISGLVALGLIATGSGYVWVEGVHAKFDLGNRTIEGYYGPGDTSYVEETNNKLDFTANPMRSIGGRGMWEGIRTTGFAINDGMEDIFRRR